MQAGKDYEIKPFGATPQRLIAMAENVRKIGSMLGPPSSIVAKREASSAWLGSGSYRPYQAAGYFTQRAWRRSIATRWKNISGDHRGATMADGASNKQQMIELMIKESHLAPDVAVEAYELSRRVPVDTKKTQPLIWMVLRTC